MSAAKIPPPKFTLPENMAGDYEPQIDEEELLLDEQALLDPEPAWKRWLAIASLVMGVITLCGWMLPYFGMPASLLGAGMGIASYRSESRNLAAAGIIMCVISFLLGLMNLLVGVYGLLWRDALSF